MIVGITKKINTASTACTNGTYFSYLSFIARSGLVEKLTKIKNSEENIWNTARGYIHAAIPLAGSSCRAGIFSHI